MHTLLRSTGPSGEDVRLIQDGYTSYIIETRGDGFVGELVVPVDPGKGAVALEDALSEFRVVCKLPRRLEQMGGNGKRDSHPVYVGGTNQHLAD